MARITITLPDEVLEAVDSRKGPASRSAWIAWQLRAATQAVTSGSGQGATWVQQATETVPYEMSLTSQPPTEGSKAKFTPTKAAAEAKRRDLPPLRRASSFVKDPDAMERQRKLNDGKGKG